MKKQLTLAANDFERFRKPTRREKFLAEMDQVVPWAELAAVIEPYYPKATRAGGRPPVGLERMLRIHYLQLWFNLSDPAVEEALYDSLAMRAFVGIDLGREPVPDETTVMRFRHLLEEHRLGEQIFAEVGKILLARGLRVSKGTIVDATIVPNVGINRRTFQRPALVEKAVHGGATGRQSREPRSSHHLHAAGWGSEAQPRSHRLLSSGNAMLTDSRPLVLQAWHCPGDRRVL